METTKQKLAKINLQIEELKKEQSKLASQVEIEKSNYERFQQCWSYKNLLETHTLSESGVWKILGEDSNPDMGGSHHQPNLGLFEGTLEKVIKHAVDLPGFWAWGGGGSIEKVKEPAIIKL